MPVSYKDFFQLKENFTMEELKQARNNKINSLAKLNIVESDKKFYAEQIINLYNEAKFDLAHSQSIFPFNSNFSLFNDNFFREIDQTLQSTFDNLNNLENFNSYSSASSYQAITNSDGSKTVIEKNKTSKNGKVEEKVNTYLVNSVGSKQPITYDEALCAFNKKSGSIHKKIDYDL